jgi:hypothetical protein
MPYTKAMAMKHLLVSDHSEQEMDQQVFAYADFVIGH